MSSDDCAFRDIIALGTAMTMSSGKPGKILYIDLGPREQAGIESLTGTTTPKTFGELCRLADKPGAALMHGYLTSAWGIDLVSGSDIAKMPDGMAARIVTMLGKSYELIIMNACRATQAQIRIAALTSSAIILCFNPDVLSMKQARSLIEMIDSFHLPRHSIKLIAGNGGSTHQIPPNQIAEYFGTELSGRIDFDFDTIMASINNGMQSLSSQPDKPINRSIARLAEILTNLRSQIEQEDTSACFQDIGITALKDSIHHDVIKELERERADITCLSMDTYTPELRAAVQRIIRAMLARHPTLDMGAKAALEQSLLDDILGLGCIEPLLKDPSVTEIMVNGPEQIYCERYGKIEAAAAAFSSTHAVMNVIDRIVAPIGRRVDESSPLVDARLPDGSRVNIVIPPLALKGPAITIRKFSEKKLRMDDLIHAGALTRPMADFLAACVRLRKNIIISGGTGSGKTTLLNIISSCIPVDERIVTIEDAAELRLPQEHVVSLETRPPSLEGTGEISIRRLVINALRMRPDRIVVGECRGGETLDMLQAMNTGHDGSLTTIHANTPKDGISRIATMAIMAGTELPDKAIKEQIASAVQVIVQLSRMSDGSRKVVEISEVCGIENDAVQLASLFTFRQTGMSDGRVTGIFAASGKLPTFFDEIASHGLHLEASLFAKEGCA